MKRSIHVNCSRCGAPNICDVPPTPEGVAQITVWRYVEAAREYYTARDRAVALLREIDEVANLLSRWRGGGAVAVPTWPGTGQVKSALLVLEYRLATLKQCWDDVPADYRVGLARPPEPW
jgi:hypothetical protein